MALVHRREVGQLRSPEESCFVLMTFLCHQVLTTSSEQREMEREQD